jgi:hypothetical protein
MWYVGTGFAVAALVGGYALASYSASSVTSNQGTYSASFGSTIWATETSTSYPKLAPASEVVSSCGGSVALNSTATTANGAVGVESGTPSCAAHDFTEEFTFQIALGPNQCASPSCSDTFTVYSVSSAGGTGTIVGSVTVDTTGDSAGYTATFNLYVDYGTAAPSTISSLEVVVSGS